jgi:hypothetical protein
MSVGSGPFIADMDQTRWGDHLVIDWRYCSGITPHFRVAAHEELLELRPRVQEAIESLEHVKERRRLTEEGLAWRRVFKVLLIARR